MRHLDRHRPDELAILESFAGAALETLNVLASDITYPLSDLFVVREMLV